MNETVPTSPLACALASCAALVLDEDGLVTTVNHTARALWRTGEGEFTHESLATLFLDEEGGEISWSCLRAQSLNRVTAVQATAHAGPPRAVHLRLEQISAPAGYLALVQPLDANTCMLAPVAGRTPDELAKANRLESLALLTGGIAREFNGHLATMLGAISLAKDRRDDTALADAEAAGLAAKALTKQLLAFASGDTAPQRTVATAKSLLTEALALAGAASPAEFSIEIADGVADVLVDRAQLLQVFQNLILNAQQAMPPPPHVPRLRLRASNVSVAAGHVLRLIERNYVAFEFCDNGVGIAPGNIEKIFQPFFTTSKHGTGLGLSTARSLVEKHGGQITVDSEPRHGSAFTVYLPRADQHADVQARRAASQRFGTGRVLVMEDDAKISGVTAAMLRALDYKCDLATNGVDAVALYKRYQNIGRPHDVVILDDTVAGGMGGEECFRALRELDPEVRAILVSGDDRADAARTSLEQGFCGYLTKPYRVSDLGKMLKTVLE